MAEAQYVKRSAGRVEWFVLGLLATIYVCNVADRLILSILAQDVKRDLHLNDLEIGLLIGPAIAFFYAILGIPMAYVADRVHRIRFLAVCLTLWSVLTALGGAAATGVQLALARIGVSAVEAGGSPTSSSIIADYFPAHQRPTAMGIYSAASTVGVMVSFALGGMLAHHVGWRWTLVAAGVPGIVLAIILVATVREPVRGARDQDAHGGALPPPNPRSLLSGFRILWASRYYRRIVLAAGVANFCFQVIVNWGPSLVMRKFMAGTGHTGLALGIGIALCGGLAAVIGGLVTSRLVKQGMERPMRIATVLQLLSCPLLLASVFSPNLPLCVALMCLAYGLQSFFIPIYWSVSQSHVPPEMRAMASAILLLAIAIFGHGIAAPVIGRLSDMLAPHYGSASLQYAIACGTVVNLLTAWLFWRAARIARREEADLHRAH